MTTEPLVGRLFLAAPLPHAFRMELAGHLRRNVGTRGLPGRVVPTDNWHLTLRFLGDTDRGQEQRLLAALDASDLGEPFDLAFDALGAFPRPDRARVLWLGAGHGAERLAALATIAEQAAFAAGFDAERRPFRAHLTLSRLRPDKDVRSIIDAVPPLGASAKIDEIVLFESHLSRDGARYETRRRFGLAVT